MNKGVVWKDCCPQAVCPLGLQVLMHWAFLISQLADSKSDGQVLPPTLTPSTGSLVVSKYSGQMQKGRLGNTRSSCRGTMGV